MTALLLMTACAGNGAGLDANGRPVGASGGGNTPLTATIDSIQQNVFTPICSVCHAGGGAPQGLRLDASNAYNLLVGVPSTEVPSIFRVKPGDPDNSYIIQKLEGHAAVGAQMPFGGPPLPAETIAVIRQWITDGAQRAAVAAVSSLEITSLAPAPGDVLAESPAQIMIGFNGALDFTRIDAGSLRLERVSVADSTHVLAIVPARLMIPTANDQSLRLTPLGSLAPGRYRLVIRDERGLELSDIAGHVLHAAAHTQSGDLLMTTFDVEARP